MFLCGAKGDLKDLANSVIELIEDKDGSFLMSISRGSSATFSGGSLPGGFERSFKNLPGFDRATCSMDMPGFDSMRESSCTLNAYDKSSRDLGDSFTCGPQVNGAKEKLQKGLARLQKKLKGTRFDKKKLSGLAAKLELDNRYSCIPAINTSNSSICSNSTYSSGITCSSGSTADSSYNSMNEMEHISTVRWTTGNNPEVEESVAPPPAKVEPATGGELVPVETTMEDIVKNLKQERDFQGSMRLDLVDADLIQKCNEKIMRAMLNANGGKLKFAIFGEELEGPSVSTTIGMPTATGVVQKLVEVAVAHR